MNADPAGNGASPPFGVSWRSEPEGVWVTVRGELDMATVERFEAALDEVYDQADGRRLVLDLRELRFIASQGLTALVRLRRRAAGSGTALLLLAPTSPVMRALRATGLAGLFAITERVPPLDGVAGANDRPG